MSVSYRIQGDLFEMTMEGTYPLEELAEVAERAFQDPDFPTHPRFLFDVSRSESLAHRTSDDVRRAVDFFARHRERLGGRCAIIASSPVQYGLARMASLLGELATVELYVTTDREDALSWLSGAFDAAR